MSSVAHKGEGGRRTQSCVFGFVENRQNFHDEAGYVRCATCVITRGVSSIRVSSRRLAVPLQDMDFERHATLLFCAKSANVQRNGAEKEK